jgi:hypothetical protein
MSPSRARLPQRIQLSRRKGWRMPVNTVNCARPGRWGNPWRIGQRLIVLSGPSVRAKCEVEIITLTRETAVEFFRRSVSGTAPSPTAARAMIRRELYGKNLACWCKPGDPCHADILLEIANSPA